MSTNGTEHRIAEQVLSEGTPPFRWSYSSRRTEEGLEFAYDHAFFMLQGARWYAKKTGDRSPIVTVYDGKVGLKFTKRHIRIPIERFIQTLQESKKSALEAGMLLQAAQASILLKAITSPENFGAALLGVFRRSLEGDVGMPTTEILHPLEA